jgi:hypothetical protein
MAASVTTAPRLWFCIGERNHALSGAGEMDACSQCPHSNDCQKVGSCLDDINAKSLATRPNQFPRLMTPAQANRCTALLREGWSLRRLYNGGNKGKPIVTPGKLQNHCAAYPEWGAEALRLAKENQQAAHRVTATVDLDLARERSAASRRNSETCSNGHVRTLESTFYVRNERQNLVRRCRVCQKLLRERRMPTSAQVRAAIEVLQHGQSLSSITPPYVQTSLRNFIIKNPKIGLRMRELSRNNHLANLRETRRLKRTVAASPVMRNNGVDAFEAVRQATSHLWEGERDDVMSLMFIAVSEGRLKLSDARLRVGEFLKAHRHRPRVYGDERFSLDNPVGEDSGLTWLDTKTDEDRLWA